MDETGQKFQQFCGKCGKIYSYSERKDNCACAGKLEFKVECKDFLKNIKNSQDMWRFSKFLPVGSKHIVSAGEGNTPVVYLEDLSRNLGIELYAKLETENPTGTFKDREASFVVSRSRELGQDNLVMQSTGNTGMAISYYAGLAGLNSFFFGPLVSLYKLTMPERTRKNRIILVDGNPLDVKRIASEFSKINGFNKISPFHERCECNATMGYEVAEKILRNELEDFDYYIQTIAAGMGPIGFYLGMKRAFQDDKIKIPKIVAVQIEDFAPCQKAWSEGKNQLDENFEGINYYEPTLHTTNAASYYQPLVSAINRSKGLMIVAERGEADFYSREIKNSLLRHGYALSENEKAGVIGYAGLRKAISEGSISRGSSVLFLLTGKGDKGERTEPDLVIRKDESASKLLERLK